jgi:hypothetical protein
VCATSLGLQVLCDGCDKGFHWWCLKLQGIPEGDWYCSGCRPATDASIPAELAPQPTAAAAVEAVGASTQPTPSGKARCEGLSAKGEQCKLTTSTGEVLCWHHLQQQSKASASGQPSAPQPEQPEPTASEAEEPAPRPTAAVAAEASAPGQPSAPPAEAEQPASEPTGAAAVDAVGSISAAEPAAATPACAPKKKAGRVSKEELARRAALKAQGEAEEARPVTSANHPMRRSAPVKRFDPTPTSEHPRARPTPPPPTASSSTPRADPKQALAGKAHPDEELDPKAAGISPEMARKRKQSSMSDAEPTAAAAAAHAAEFTAAAPKKKKSRPSNAELARRAALESQAEPSSASESEEEAAEESDLQQPLQPPVQPVEEEAAQPQCEKMTLKGGQCSRRAAQGERVCKLHLSKQVQTPSVQTTVCVGYMRRRFLAHCVLGYSGHCYAQPRYRKLPRVSYLPSQLGFLAGELRTAAAAAAAGGGGTPVTGRGDGAGSDGLRLRRRACRRRRRRARAQEARPPEQRGDGPSQGAQGVGAEGGGRRTPPSPRRYLTLATHRTLSRERCTGGCTGGGVRLTQVNLMKSASSVSPNRSPIERDLSDLAMCSTSTEVSLVA